MLVVIVSPAFILRGTKGSLRHPILWRRHLRRRRHTLYSGQYLKNGLSDFIQMWHVDVTGPGGVLYSFVALNSH